MKSTGQKLIASLATRGESPDEIIKSVLLYTRGNYVRAAGELKVGLDSFRGAIETLDLGEWIHERWPLRSQGGRPRQDT